MADTPESKWILLRRVLLAPQHPQPSRTKHTLIDSTGSRSFSDFLTLEIIYNGPESYYLMHICQDGTGTDTWHQSLEEALDQANYEFEVKPEEWTIINTENA